MLADRTTETRQVRTGISNRIQIQILSGLQEGEQVILTAMRSTGAGANSNSGPPFRRYATDALRPAMQPLIELRNISRGLSQWRDQCHGP